jgi:hypothetical protein
MECLIILGCVPSTWRKAVPYFSMAAAADRSGGASSGVPMR